MLWENRLWSLSSKLFFVDWEGLHKSNRLEWCARAAANHQIGCQNLLKQLMMMIKFTHTPTPTTLVSQSLDTVSRKTQTNAKHVFRIRGYVVGSLKIWRLNHNLSLTKVENNNVTIKLSLWSVNVADFHPNLRNYCKYKRQGLGATFVAAFRCTQTPWLRGKAPSTVSDASLWVEKNKHNRPSSGRCKQ